MNDLEQSDQQLGFFKNRISGVQARRSYAPSGKTILRRKKDKPKRINLISTHTKQGKLRFMFRRDTMNSQHLSSFLRGLVKYGPKKFLLILNNLHMHHSKLVDGYFV